jgi:alpha-mannosidase
MPFFEAERSIEIAQLRNRLREIESTIYTQRQPIGPIEISVTGHAKGPDRAPRNGWKPFRMTELWGGYDQTTWFRMTLTVPKSMRGETVVALLRPSSYNYITPITGYSDGGEALVYVNGVPAHGLDRNRDELFLVKKAKGGEKFEIVLEACPSTRFDTMHLFAHADVAAFHRLPWEFYWDGTVALNVVEAIPANTAHRRHLLELLNEAIKTVDLQHIGKPAYTASLKRAQRMLRDGLRRFESNEPRGRLVLAGHAHIDTAWLWPVRETKRKCSRTFATMLDLMTRYPEFHFSCSQPVQYEWMKLHYPDIFESIKQRVKEGRWELCGAAWVEPDHNVPSGESLIRQYLYGNRWFEREFGQRSAIAWVPDSFGYTWALPQIMKTCQLKAFVTTKIDWNQLTKFPYSMFLWEGADGTRMPAVMPPLNYNGNPTPQNCIAQWDLFHQKERVQELPFAYGWGDGGGGPTMTMLEHGRRLANIVDVPQCEFGRVEDSVARMLEQCDLAKLPVYNDELYLELHRACQITQARTKRNNRKCEVALHNAEFLGCLALLHGGAYDRDNLWEAWKIVLTNQFHDILPGSSITEVYTQCDIDYATAREHIARAQRTHLKPLLKQIDTRGDGTPIVVFNPLSWVRTDVVTANVPLPRRGFSVRDPEGNPVPCQHVGKDQVLFEARNVPPLGYAVYRVVPGARAAEDAGELAVTTRGIENEYLRISFDNAGRLTRVYDKIEERDVLPKGQKANVLQLFDDRPFLHDAWDTDFNFEEIMWEPATEEAAEVRETGPVRAVVRVARATQKSTITQDITMYANSPRVDFNTRVDWHEKRLLMKVAFPVDVRATSATFEMQYCAVERATHDNRAHDRATFEVTGHKWIDLSEGNYGVSLLNDCKYGHDVKNNVLRLSLLRAPVDPDPKADEGEHKFTYSLYPHGGDWRNGTVQQGFELNNPMIAVEARPAKGALPPAGSLVAVDAENVIIDAVKKHEDSDALIIRLYEAYGQRGDFTLTFGTTPGEVTECDGMEENDTPVKLRGNSVNGYITPFQIRTFKVSFSH